MTRAIASDERLSETAGVLRSIPGIGPVARTMLIAEMPEIGTITGGQAAALTVWPRSRTTVEHFAGNGPSLEVAVLCDT
ncbi:hypothetical protein EP867_19290 [Falsigemmobacter intermedius]|uniref:IS110 family transposase n=1 Tax=Falsigemmobacter intermedius TaxID=1553448 RepID=A0A3S3VF39_9RHOB|nr:hypothetical protein EP867_19290 [Falsigemmobacter intermedius]